MNTSYSFVDEHGDFVHPDEAFVDSLGRLIWSHQGRRGISRKWFHTESGINAIRELRRRAAASYAAMEADKQIYHENA
jgi:hypothetical protein